MNHPPEGNTMKSKSNSPIKAWLHEQYTRLTPQIEAERVRQIGEEGHTLEKDRGKAKQLRAAARCYQRQAITLDRHPGRILSVATLAAAGEPWPWAERFWKPTDDVDRMLVKAGALMMASVDAEAML